MHECVKNHTILLMDRLNQEHDVEVRLIPVPFNPRPEKSTTWDESAKHFIVLLLCHSNLKKRTIVHQLFFSVGSLWKSQFQDPYISKFDQKANWPTKHDIFPCIAEEAAEVKNTDLQEWYDNYDLDSDSIRHKKMYDNVQQSLQWFQECGIDPEEYSTSTIERFCESMEDDNA